MPRTKRNIGLATGLLIAAAVAFVLAAVNVTLGTLNLTALGLALFVGAFIVRDLT